jgi:hypothetical protein
MAIEIVLNSFISVHPTEAGKSATPTVNIAHSGLDLKNAAEMRRRFNWQANHLQEAAATVNKRPPGGSRIAKTETVKGRISASRPAP